MRTCSLPGTLSRVSAHTDMVTSLWWNSPRRPSSWACKGAWIRGFKGSGQGFTARAWRAPLSLSPTWRPWRSRSTTPDIEPPTLAPTAIKGCWCGWGEQGDRGPRAGWRLRAAWADQRCDAEEDRRGGEEAEEAAGRISSGLGVELGRSWNEEEVVNEEEAADCCSGSCC